MNKRDNGFIDLNLYFQNKYNTDNLEILEQANVVKDELGMSKTGFWINCNDNKVLFKETPNLSCAYIELISEELIRMIGLESAHYDLAKFDNCYGVISYNYKLNNYKYITMYDIFNKLSFKERFDLNKSNNIWSILNNNLEDIWNALDAYFKNNTNRQVIVKNVMNDIVKLFVFDLIMNQDDRHAANYGLCIDKEGNVKLAPVYDYERSLNLDENYKTNIILQTDRNENKLKKNEIIINYLKKSSSEFIKLFNEILDIINIDSLKVAIQNVENRTHYNIPSNIKEKIYNNFLNNYKKIVNIVKKFDENNNIKRK